MSPIFISAIAGAQASRQHQLNSRQRYNDQLDRPHSVCPMCAGIIGLGMLGAVGFSFIPGIGTMGGFLIGIASGLLVSLMYWSVPDKVNSSRLSLSHKPFYSLRKTTKKNHATQNKSTLSKQTSFKSN